MSQGDNEPSATVVDSSGNPDLASNHGEKQGTIAKDSGNNHDSTVEPEYYSGLRLWIIMSTILLSTLLSALDIVSQLRSFHERRIAGTTNNSSFN